MKYNGRITAVTLTLVAHTSFVVYFSILFNNLNIVSILGYIIWFSIGYWTGKQYDKAKYFSEKDPLTHLYNRRFVISAFEKITSLAQRTNNKYYLLIIDCDNFKDINDIHGHQKGDLVLSMIAESLVCMTTKNDIVARWGGDEFLVIGHYKDEADLETVIERLESEHKSLSHKLEVPVIVSLGSALFPEHSTDLFGLIKIADGNMYNNKRMKRSHI
jgi:diguanylate cyclase (GGDEF)-like protein